ncbi:MAG: uroporphyrinogen-III C-methyltransferase [Mariprofundaceae bacterium]|nr:uroporphyrinogen-III C-methyltransferase [Mariprofundaceae bacterium]
MKRALSAPLAAGEIALVGAGPGDPDLLTVAAMKLLGDCDAIVHDALVPQAVLDHGCKSATMIRAGKRGGRASVSQADICDTLIRLAREGKRVVRLKGGDPFIFGRGGEEIRTLARAGIRFRVIPGITSGIAAPAMAGIPLTDRSVNSTLAFLTGHEASGESRIDWQAMVAAFPVLVFYMGARLLPDIARRLLAAGMKETTPVAVIHAATWPRENIVSGMLADVLDGSLEAQSPSIVVIGDVVASRVDWRDA